MSKKGRGCVGLALLGLAMWNSVVFAAEATPSSGVVSEVAEDVVPEHGKLNTADASPVDPGHLELEASYAFTHSGHFWDNDGVSTARAQTRQQVLGLTATFGVLADVDMAVSGSYVWLEDKDNDFDPGDGELGPEQGRGLGDLAISGRYRFYASKEQHLAMAYIAGVTVPTGSSSSRDAIGTSQEFWSFNQTLVANKDWGKWTANVDVGYALPWGEKSDRARGTFRADGAVGYQILPWLQPEIELNYSHGFFVVDNDKEVVAVTAGLVMPLTDRLRVNTGVQQGLWGRNADNATCLYAAVKVAF